jgi:hypothetical protein
LTQLQAQIPRWERRVGWFQKHWAEAVCRGEQLRSQLPVVRDALAALRERRAQLAAENVAQADASCWRIWGFSSGENLTLLLELGYDLDTKAHGTAGVRALQARTTAPTPWTRVGQNVEMVAWPEYYLRTCPYPLTVGLERFHTPEGWQYSALLGYHSDEGGRVPDLAVWFHEYNARASVEAGIKQEKTVFRGLQRESKCRPKITFLIRGDCWRSVSADTEAGPRVTARSQRPWRHRFYEATQASIGARLWPPG